MTLKEKFSVGHIIKEGARYHVHSYSLMHSMKKYRSFSVRWCSEPFCEDNLSGVEACLEHGLDPAKCIPSVNAKEWLRSEEGRKSAPVARMD